MLYHVPRYTIYEPIFFHFASNATMKFGETDVNKYHVSSVTSITLWRKHPYVNIRRHAFVYNQGHQLLTNDRRTRQQFTRCHFHTKPPMLCDNRENVMMTVWQRGESTLISDLEEWRHKSSSRVSSHREIFLNLGNSNICTDATTLSTKIDSKYLIFLYIFASVNESLALDTRDYILRQNIRYRVRRLKTKQGEIQEVTYRQNRIYFAQEASGVAILSHFRWRTKRVNMENFVSAYVEVGEEEFQPQSTNLKIPYNISWVDFELMVSLTS